MQIRHHTQHHTETSKTIHGQFHPATSRQQGNGCQCDRHLNRRGRLRPAMMLVHLLLGFLIPVARFLLQRLGFGLDLAFLCLVTLDGFGIALTSLGLRDDIQRELSEVLLAALCLIVIPLIRGFSLFDRCVILE